MDGLERERVPGGWIYRSRRVTFGMQQPPDALVFVPDDPERRQAEASVRQLIDLGLTVEDLAQLNVQRHEEQGH